MISSIRCLRSALSSWLDTMDPLPGLGLMVPPYDAPPTSTGTNRASYLLRSRLPRLHTFSASFSAIQIFQHTFRNCALVIDLDFIADSLAESRKFLVGLHHTRMVYTSSTMSLCLLEFFVHFDPGVADISRLNLEYRWADISDRVPTLEISRERPSE